VSTRHYFAFGALVSEELSYKLKGIFAFSLLIIVLLLVGLLLKYKYSVVDFDTELFVSDLNGMPKLFG
jgi:hypothetical protein